MPLRDSSQSGSPVLCTCIVVDLMRVDGQTCIGQKLRMRHMRTLPKSPGYALRIEWMVLEPDAAERGRRTLKSAVPFKKSCN